MERPAEQVCRRSDRVRYDHRTSTRCVTRRCPTIDARAALREWGGPGVRSLLFESFTRFDQALPTFLANLYLQTVWR